MTSRTDPTSIPSPSPAFGWTARVPTFAAAHIIVLTAAAMVAISTVYGLLPRG